MNRYKNILFALSLFLPGCVPVVVGGAAATAAVIIVNDHRTSPTKASDKRIQTDISNKIQSYSELHDQAHIVVTVFSGDTLLTGQAPNQKLKNKASQLALSVPGVAHLYNEIQVENPNSSLTRVSDYWITTKINTLLLKDKSLRSAQVQVVTQDGVVYLLGSATREQKTVILKTANDVSGVQKVVPLFT